MEFTQPVAPKRPRRTRQPLEGEAALIAAHMKEVWWRGTAHSTRSMQQTLGPSEIGHECDRRLAYKLAGYPTVNPTASGWAAWVGTQIHRGLAELFAEE